MTAFRRLTKVVDIGGIPLGGNNPVRIQSMTNTNTLDTGATVRQIIALHQAGVHYVRMTAMNIREAENLAEIKRTLHSKGIQIPLVADVHFNPEIAKIAARHVEKVRINPGNYGGMLPVKEYSEKEYITSFEKARKEFVDLLHVCRENNTALRIGVNHGSLSPRIVSKYGDTPAGMVESAMEFLRICEEERFTNVVVSLKSSNTRLMVQANLLMVKEMDEAGMNYPLHLGVTEAGNEEDGRIKSAVGIGMLLANGIGDTIRVSLTEDPVREIPVAKNLAEFFTCKEIAVTGQVIPIVEKTMEFSKRESSVREIIGGKNPPVVIVSVGLNEVEKLFDKSDQNPDFIFVRDEPVSAQITFDAGIIQNYAVWINGNTESKKVFPILSAEEYLLEGKKSHLLNFVNVTKRDLSDEFVKRIQADKTIVLVSNAKDGNSYHAHFALFEKLQELNPDVPLIIRQVCKDADFESFLLKSSVHAGGLFLSGMGDGIWLEPVPPVDAVKVKTVSFGILQAVRARITTTEFISCPSCGRTMFDIEKVSLKVKRKMAHLTGLKIAVMGCIVNGPGEMADADYGYIGGARGKVSLFKGKKLVKKDVPESTALDELVKLIKDYGDWKEPE